MAKYLVTGGAGFIGSNLVDALVAGGDKVVVLDDMSTGSRKNLQDQRSADVKLHEADIRDEKEVRKAAKGCDYLLHLACPPGVEPSVQDPKTAIEIAAVGTLNCLIAARDMKVKRVVFASSAAVYGESPVLPKEENMLPTPYAPIGAGALMGEELTRVFYTTYRLETVSLRLFNVYGPRQSIEGPHGGVVGAFCASILRGETPVVFGDGKQSRDFIYVSDVIEAFRLACVAPKAEGEVFNIASGSRLSVGGLITMFGTMLEREITPSFGDARSSDVRHGLADIVKAQEVLGFRPRVRIAEGLAKTLLWYKKNLPKTSRARAKA